MFLLLSLSYKINFLVKTTHYMENEKRLIQGFAKELLNKRQTHNCTIAIKGITHSFVDEILQLLFPHYSVQQYYTEDEIIAKHTLLKRNLKNLLKSLNNISEGKAVKISDQFGNRLPEISEKLWIDAEAIYKGDPAAESVDEVILAYPGFLAIAIYRIAHELYVLDVPVLPRIMTEYAHQITGVDIHPGAFIDAGFVIDHGTGVVIGETSIIGKNVKIYQGVTLGALSVDKKMAKTKRHPTIEDNVVIYSQAVILGGDTIIGSDSIIGGNAWITESVPPRSVVYHKSEVKVRKQNENHEIIDFCI